MSTPDERSAPGRPVPVRHRPTHTDGMAITGVVTGGLATVLLVIFIIVVVVRASSP